MSLEAKTVVAELAAELCVRVAGKSGELGVFAENLPPLDAGAFVRAVAALAKSPLRVALLGLSAAPKVPKGLTITVDPTEANRWRNDAAARSGTRCIALVLGPAPKLNSLRTALSVVGPRELRDIVVDKGIALLDSPERRSFWSSLRRRKSDVPTTHLIDFLARLTAAAQASDAALLDQEPQLVHLIGLLQAPTLTKPKGPAAAAQAIRRNTSLVARLARLSQRDRAIVLAAAEQDETREAAAQILRYERTGGREHLEGLALAVAQAILVSKSKATEDADTKPPSQPAERLEGDSLALELILADDAKGLKSAAKKYSASVTTVDGEPGDEEHEDEAPGEQVPLQDRVVRPRHKPGTTETLGVLGQLHSSDVWGGFVCARDAEDLVAALKLFGSGDAEAKPFRPSDEAGVRGMLHLAVNQGLAQPDALSAWDDYAAARSALLDNTAVLVDHPLLALGASDAQLSAAERVVEQFGRALRAIQQVSRTLREQGSAEPAKRLFAQALALDVVFVETSGEVSAIAAPTHPFHLWRWATMVRLLREHREELAGIGADTLEALVSEPLAVAPHVLLSPFAVDDAVERAKPLVAVGSFAGLPLFGEPTSRRLGKFRGQSLTRIAERLLRLMPHAAYGLRVLLVDPPSVAAALEELLLLRNPLDDEDVVPIHATVARTRSAPEATEEDQADLERMARELRDAGGTINVLPAPAKNASPHDRLKSVAREASKQPSHFTVVFEPGEAQERRVTVVAPPVLSPLVMSRVYQYDRFDDRIDVITAGDNIPFSAYHEMFCDALDMPRTDFVGRKSGSSKFAKDIEELGRSSVWLTIVDHGLEPTLRIGESVRLNWQSESGRDVLTLTSHPEMVEDLVRDATRLVGLTTSAALTKRTLAELAELSGDLLLSLAKPKPGINLADPNIARGTLGVLKAVRWYRDVFPDALIVSLDDPLSRRWILGAGTDDRHGDLLAIRAGDSGPVVEALEVKAHESEDMGVVVHGTRVEGRAVTQVDQTLTTLKRILASGGGQSVIDRARREILKDELYRAVAARPYQRDRRWRIVQILDSLFRDGPAALRGQVIRVAIQPNDAVSAPSSAKYLRSPADNEVGVVDLVESGIPEKPAPSASRTSTPLPAPKQAPSRPSPPASSTSKPLVAVREEPATEPSMPAAPVSRAGTPELSILVGHTAAGDAVKWEPHRPDNPLNNFGFLVTGDPGAGKTQMLRALISEVAKLGIPVCVFDFKNDYGAPDFAEPVGLQTYDVDRDGLPFNPLSLIAGERGEAQPIRQITTIAEILRRIFRLGDQQEAQLKKALKEAYEARGLKPDQWHKVSEAGEAPGFDEVRAILEQKKGTEALLNRLSPLFDLNLFPGPDRAQSTFESLLSHNVVLDLHNLPNDSIKQAIAEFLIVRLHWHVLRGDQPRRLRRFLVFDEAWRVKESERLEALAREGRAFGVGIAIGTQFPGDLPDNLAGNLATQLLLQNSDPEHRKAIARTLCGASSGPSAQQIMSMVAKLRKHEGFFRNQHFAPYVLLATTPHYKRLLDAQNGGAR